MGRYFLQLAYDGSAYCGWQVQPGVSTVQDTLEKALQVLVPDAGSITGCGRTDTGVHASDYYAHFDTEKQVPNDLVHRINRMLPRDIAVMRCFATEPEMHARYSAIRRTYKYYMHFRKNPFENQYSVYQPKPLDLAAMNVCAKMLVGTRDFKSFSRSQTQLKNHICTVYHAEWELSDHGAVFTIAANRFLRNMVRAIVGTLVKAGQGMVTPDQFMEIMDALDRRRAGKSAPAQGLFLHEIHYPEIHESGNR